MGYTIFRHTHMGIQTLGVSSWIQSIIMIAWHQIEMLDTHGAFTAHFNGANARSAFHVDRSRTDFMNPGWLMRGVNPPRSDHMPLNIIKLDDWAAHSKRVTQGSTQSSSKIPKGQRELHSCKPSSDLSTLGGKEQVKSECPMTWVIKCPHFSHHPTIRFH